MPHDVFISYTTRDKATADAVCHALEARHIRCWIAPRDVQAGLSWKAAIVGAIRSARVMVLIFSGEVNGSPDVRREVDIAFEEGRPIIPFRIENVTPSDDLYYCIADRHWLDAITPPVEQHIGRLVDALRQFVGEPAVPAVPAPVEKPSEPAHTTQPALRAEESVPDMHEIPGGGADREEQAPPLSLIDRVGRARAITAAALIVGVLAAGGFWSLRADYDAIAAKGIEAYAAKKYDEAAPLLRKAAEGGNARAQAELSRAYYAGHGVAKDMRAAKQWAERAAAQGDSGGDTTLGYMYFDGTDATPKDEPRGLRLLLNAAERQNPRAQAKIGWAYEYGKGGFKQDVDEAMRWYRKAAAQGNSYSQCAIATHLTQLQNLTEKQKADNYAEAVQLYRSAAEQPDTCGQVGYGYMLWNGFGVAKSYDQAMLQWERAAAQGDETAKQNIERVQDDWVLQPLFPGAWRRVTGDERREEIKRIASLADKVSEPAFQRMRRLDLSFYDGASLFEVEVASKSGEAGILTYIRRGGATTVIDGLSKQIHELSKSAPIRIDTQQQAVAFMRFFMAALQSQDSNFRVIDDVKQLHWAGDQASSRPDVSGAIRPFEVYSSPSGGWQGTGTIQFGNHLFLAKLRLSPEGMVEMTEDEAVATSLPIKHEQFDSSRLRRAVGN